jgi:hypothetical protein
LAVAISLAAIGCFGAVAQADQTVVRALVYTGGSGATIPQQVGLSTLSGCTPYSGSNPIYLYENGQATPQQLPSTTWALSTVLTCALQIPLSNVTGVQVALENTYQGFESPLSSGQLTDPSQFHDPDAPDALPVISTDGSEDLNTYTRPWLGGSDNNAADQVTESGAPVTIAVYENAPPLVVHVSWATVSRNATTMRIKFITTVRAASGTAVPASSLAWSWSFASGPGSRAATPTHSFTAGVSPVTVQVTDASVGTAGTATVDVSAHPSAAPGKHTHGGGSKKNKSTATVGADHTSGATQNTTTATTSQTSTTPQTTTTSTHTTSHPHRSTIDTAKPTPRKRAPRHLQKPAATIRGSVVQGLLISNVTPVAPGLVDRAKTRSSPPLVRPATRASSLAIVLSGLAILALLGLGAGYELRGRRNWRALRVGN